MTSISPLSPTLNWVAASLFGLAIIHTFLVKWFHHLAYKFDSGSVGKNLFQLLGEVEIVFGLWAAVLLAFVAVIESPSAALTYFESRNFTEPAFVFAILALCSTQPILNVAESWMSWIARLMPLPRTPSFFITVLTLGPILGSLITEPAAMTVTAALLLKHFLKKTRSLRFKYAVLGTLFVNISIGGTLTPYAAPPILMVAEKWGWGLRDMLWNFGWKGALACLASSSLLAFHFRTDLRNLPLETSRTRSKSPIWLKLFHLFFLGIFVIAAHHPLLVIGLFLLFLGFFQVTRGHQSPLRLKEGLLVSLFLGGLVTLGGMQGWWLEQVLDRLTALPLYLGAMGLTAFTDNAALTYLGTLVPSLSETSRYALVAGAVAGGGLTVIANAPNPVGQSILQPAFDKEGISPILLLKNALIPTGIAAFCFWFL